MAPQVLKVLNESDYVIGYKTYMNLLKDIIQEQQIISSGMRKEKDRAREAVNLAKEGKVVSVVSSGDPGVYGMAGITMEIADGEVDVEVIPGITAATAAAACLGAPLMHDFAVISLSDLLTPWEKIVKRLDAAAQSDMIIVLYNPKSKTRVKHIEIAREIILKYQSSEIPVGLVRNAKREGEEVIITTLGEMLEKPIDMLTTVVIGNSETKVLHGKIVTPRGYQV